MNDYPFKPDFGKHRFTLTIEAFENAHTLTIKTPTGDSVVHKPTYTEMIGVVEVVKADFLRKHAKLSNKENKKRRKQNGDGQ